jgi:hypothetical protein
MPASVSSASAPSGHDPRVEGARTGGVLERVRRVVHRRDRGLVHAATGDAADPGSPCRGGSDRVTPARAASDAPATRIRAQPARMVLRAADPGRGGVRREPAAAWRARQPGPARGRTQSRPRRRCSTGGVRPPPSPARSTPYANGMPDEARGELPVPLGQNNEPLVGCRRMVREDDHRLTSGRRSSPRRPEG